MQVNIVVNGKTITVILHPPTGARKSWYVYWNGLVASKSTGKRRLEDAIKAVEGMLQNGGERTDGRGAVPTDEEFEAIQRRHFGKKQDDKARERAEKSLTACLEAIRAFREITGLDPIALATPDDCEQFQHDALELPRNWRSKHPRSRKDGGLLSPNTILKWSGALQAAYERANRNAGKKCVRGVVPETRLLTENPWFKFTWIDRRKKAIRQFTDAEIISFLDYLETEWASITLAPLMAKVHIWSACRREEVAGLRWDDLRQISDDEIHFDVTGKWSVRRWFRIPAQLYRELLANQSGNPVNRHFVFGGLLEQVSQFHLAGKRPWMADWVEQEFNQYNTGRWFYERVRGWSKSLPDGNAYTHIFRKTTLQYARQGEDINRQVAQDASVTTSVMMASYVTEREEELRQKSNRFFARIAARLHPTVAARYGYLETPTDALKRRLRLAVDSGDWKTAAEIAARLDDADNSAA